jgi:hypothetical protein
LSNVAFNNYYVVDREIRVYVKNGNALLSYQGNSGYAKVPQCYVILALVTLLNINLMTLRLHIANYCLTILAA